MNESLQDLELRRKKLFRQMEDLAIVYGNGATTEIAKCMVTPARRRIDELYHGVRFHMRATSGVRFATCWQAQGEGATVARGRFSSSGELVSRFKFSPHLDGVCTHLIVSIWIVRNFNMTDSLLSFGVSGFTYLIYYVQYSIQSIH